METPKHQALKPKTPVRYLSPEEQKEKMKALGFDKAPGNKGYMTKRKKINYQHKIGRAYSE